MTSIRAQLLRPLQGVESRGRLISAVLALALLATLPLPGAYLGSRAVLVLALWAAVGALAWSSWFQPTWVLLAWTVSLTLAFVTFWRLHLPLPVVFLSLWAFYRRARQARVSKLLLLFFLVAPAWAAKKPKKPLAVPKYLTGYKLNDVSSCQALDQIPWRFRADGRRTRLLFKDQLRYQTDLKESLWEVHQVVDARPEQKNENPPASFVFRRALPDGRFESIIVRDAKFERVVDAEDGPKTLENQDFKLGLLNRPALTFYHRDGSTLIYQPSAPGNSALILQLSQGPTGRLLPPVFVRGSRCDRPDDEENSDSFNRALNTTPPTAGGASAPAAPAPAAGAAK